MIGSKEKAFRSSECLSSIGGGEMHSELLTGKDSKFSLTLYPEV